MLDPRHVLPLLQRKHRAVPGATALQQWDMPEVFLRLRAALRERTRKPDQEWVRVLRQRDGTGVVVPAPLAQPDLLASVPTPDLQSCDQLGRGA